MIAAPPFSNPSILSGIPGMRMFVLILNIIPTLEPFNPSCGIHHFPFTGKERMALAA